MQEKNTQLYHYNIFQKNSFFLHVTEGLSLHVGVNDLFQATPTFFMGWISIDMGSVPFSDKNLLVPLGNPYCIFLCFICKKTVLLPRFSCILSLKLGLMLFLIAYL